MRQTLRLFTFVIWALNVSAVAEELYGNQAALGWPGHTIDGRRCSGPIGRGFGPFDYMDPKNHRKKLPLVEDNHFTPPYERLQVYWPTLISDLDYTIRAFPNHHRALWAFIRLYARDPRRAKDFYTKRHDLAHIECYLQRAIKFRPKDWRVRMLFGIYLQRRKLYDMALARYQEAEALAPKSAELQYNLALLLVAMKRYEKAIDYAKRAYNLGYPLQGLRKKLKHLGYWK